MEPKDLPKVRIRMYRQGLGDCFLLTFFTGGQPAHMLIDCGTLGATTTGVKMEKVVANIAEETKKHLDLLVITHEHKDHVSGFASESEIFKTIQVDQVWVAWTENPNDDLAKEIERFKGDLLDSLRLASETLQNSKGTPADEQRELRGMAEGVRNLLGFSGDLPADGGPLALDFAKTVNAAMNFASHLAGTPEFLSPGRIMEPFAGVRMFVLGPPRKKEALLNLGDHDSPELYGLTQRLSAGLTRTIPFHSSKLSMTDYLKVLPVDNESRQNFEAGLPFDNNFRIEAGDKATWKHYYPSYDDASENWRRIEYDWLTTTGSLALQMDSATNNTSLALAIQLTDGRVLLFPADAQLGNWKSWQELEFTVGEGANKHTVTSEDLLQQTVFYKVGHHSSHNATLKQHGLESMQQEELVAMIPVDRAVALKKNPPWQMPADALYKALLKKTSGRVLRSDTGFPTDKPEGLNQAQWDAIRGDKKIVITDLYIEYHLF